MALSAKVGSFDTGTGAVSSTVAVSGLGFQPTAVIFWLSGRTESTDTNARASHFRGFGFATSTTSRYAFTTASTDAAGTSDAGAQQRNDACVAVCTAAGAINGRLDLQSFDSDGFTLVVDQVFAASRRVAYLALGGDSITNQGTTSFAELDGTGTVDYTGLGFQPSMVIICTIATDAFNAAAANSQLCIGWATGAGQEGLLTVGAADAAGTSNSYHTASSVECGEQIAGSFGGSEHSRFQLSTFLSTGFRLNWLEGNNDAHLYGVLALAGVSARVGEMLSSTGTSDIVTTGVGFQPAAVMFTSASSAENVTNTITDHDRWSVGAGDGTSQVVQAVTDRDAQGTTVVSTGINFANVYAAFNAGGPTYEGTMELRTLDTDGFTNRMTDADPSARFISYLALGPAAAGAATTFVHWYEDDAA